MKRTIHKGMSVIKAYKQLIVLYDQLIGQFLIPDAPKLAVASVYLAKTVVTIGITAPYFEMPFTFITRGCRGEKAQEEEGAWQRKALLDVMTEAVEITENRAIDPEIETRRIPITGGNN